MNDIYRAVQQLARSVQAAKLPIERIVELADTGLDKADVILHLRKESNQRELAINWETLLYRHTSGQYVLICTALPDNPKDAHILATRRLINSREACSFCNLIEGSFAPLELVVATSPVGIAIQGELVHKRCALSWQRLKLIAEGK